MEIRRDETNTRQIMVRGLNSDTSSGVKILIDGHALNDPISGGATMFYDDLPLKNVRRIEVIRGPASCLVRSECVCERGERADQRRAGY